MDSLTLIKSKTPEKVCKTYSLDEAGSLVKKAIANISEGRARKFDVPDAQGFIDLLNLVTERQNLVLCPGIWHESQVDQEFRVITEKALCDLLGDEIGKVQGGVIDHQGQLVSARLARGIDYSNWLLTIRPGCPLIGPRWVLPIGCSFGNRLYRVFLSVSGSKHVVRQLEL